jgi:tetratricopeptide (TPR) repeat protein
MARLTRNLVPAIGIVGIVASLWLLFQARASLRERDEQVQRLRERLAQFEEDAAHRSSMDAIGLAPDELKAYLSLPYEEFDATPGSGHRRFRDQPRNPAQAGALIEAYLESHPELPLNQRTNLQGHAAQLFAMGGRYERAITYLDRQRAQNPRDAWANATKAFLLFDREGLLAARRQMADGEPTDLIDYLIDHFGESYLDISRWEPICSTVRVPAGASANHRAAAVLLATALGLAVTIAPDAPAESGIAGECIWLEVRPMDGMPDMEGYIILHGTKRTVITASDEQRLNAAVKRFIESTRQHNGQRQAPSGLATSFDLAR